MPNHQEQADNINLPASSTLTGVMPINVGSVRIEDAIPAPEPRVVRVGDWVYWWEKRSGPQSVDKLPLSAEPYPAFVVNVRPPQGSETEPRANLFVAKEGLWIIVQDKARADEPTHGCWCWKD